MSSLPSPTTTLPETLRVAPMIRAAAGPQTNTNDAPLRRAGGEAHERGAE